MKPAEPTLVRDGENGWFTFSDRVGEISAIDAGSVPAALRAVERRSSAGLHCVGFITYEAAPAFDSALRVKKSDCGPVARFQVFRNREPLQSLPISASTYSLHNAKCSLSRSRYMRAITTIKTLLKRGATYQVNFTFPISYDFAGDPFSMFCQLQRNQQSLYSAFIDMGDMVICSVSPELFFEKNDSTVESKPMKGTAARMPDSARDAMVAAELAMSGKNSAENVMIVDMIRNDLGRIAQPGSVKVKSFFDLERYPTVYQATSTVTGEVNASLMDLLSALFPCASVTGAPKVETMKIISELEPSPRGIYTGAIGYVSPDKTSFNVGIRTLLIDRAKARAVYGVGSGIVWESSAQSEYDECIAKALVLNERIPEFELLETILWENKGGYAYLDAHICRIQASALYFGFCCPERMIRGRLATHAERCSERMIVRLLLSREGSIRIQAAPLPRQRQPWRVAIAKVKADPSERFLYHKTTNRKFYEAALAERPGLDDMILLNNRGELTESCKANIVVVKGRRHLTPPVSCGLLPGTYRDTLLKAGRLQESILTPCDLKSADEVYLINSVRGRIPIVLEADTRPVA